MTSPETIRKSDCRKNGECCFLIWALSFLLPRGNFYFAIIFQIAVGPRLVRGILQLKIAAATIQKTCVGLSDTLGALKRRPFCSMGCVVLNIEATTQPGSLSWTGDVWKRANVPDASQRSQN